MLKYGAVNIFRHIWPGIFGIDDGLLLPQLFFNVKIKNLNFGGCLENSFFKIRE